MVIAEFIFYFSTIVHLLITISLGWPIWRYKNAAHYTRSENGFSIIICAHNELENLKQNVPSILEQDYTTYEVIIVLDRSTDDSFEFLQEIFSKDSRLKVLTINHIPEGFHPKKYGLTKAIEIAQFDWILLTDADSKPRSKNWIKTFNALITPQKEIILGLSPYLKNHGLLANLISFETYQTALTYIGTALQKKAYMGVGRNLAYRKNLFLDGDGFGPYKDITGGDDDLFVQQNATSTNTAINIDRDSITNSQPKRKWIAYLHQKTRHLSVVKFYLSGIKFRLTFYALTHMIMWLSFIILVSFNPGYWIISACFALVMLIKGLISIYTSQKLHIEWNLIWFPILDLVYAVLLPLIGLRSFLIKKIRWN
jgi:glycosyltransferase involved in cell wall biosynthesis